MLEKVAISLQQETDFYRRAHFDQAHSGLARRRHHHGFVAGRDNVSAECWPAVDGRWPVLPRFRQVRGRSPAAGWRCSLTIENLSIGTRQPLPPGGVSRGARNRSGVKEVLIWPALGPFAGRLRGKPYAGRSPLDRGHSLLSEGLAPLPGAGAGFFGPGLAPSGSERPDCGVATAAGQRQAFSRTLASLHPAGPQ